MPDGVPMAWMAGLYDHRPVFVAHGEGCRFTDVDGNTYVDFNQADLSASCGFAPPAVLAAIAERAARGHAVPAPGRGGRSRRRELLAERYELPGWQFTLSASGANAEAIRLARHRTGRDRSIVVFGGHYHGHLDDTLVTGDEQRARARPARPQPARRGRHAARPVQRPRRARAGPRARRTSPRSSPSRRSRTSASCCPTTASTRACARLTRAHGTLLVLDETHTQTVAYGGLTRAWGLEPDVVTLGKSLGGGMPVGAYGMTAELRDHLEEPPRRVRPRDGDRHRRDDLRQPAVARRRRRDAHARPDAGGVRAVRSARRPARRRDRGAGRASAGCRGARTGSAAAPGICLEPELPRNADEAARSIDAALIDARRLHHREPRHLGCDRQRRAGGLVRPHGGGRRRVSGARSARSSTTCSRSRCG